MVKYLTINEQETPIRVSYYALKHLREKLGRGIDPSGDGSDYEGYETLLYFALKKGHEKVKPNEPFPFVQNDMEDVMDQVYFEFMKLVPLFFADQLPEVITSGKKGVSTAKK